MITINKSLVLSAALAAAALVAAFETSPRAAVTPAADQVAQRFPLPAEMFTPVPLTTYIAPKFIAAQKAAAVQASRRVQFCDATPSGWPYISHECLVG